MKKIMHLPGIVLFFCIALQPCAQPIAQSKNISDVTNFKLADYKFRTLGYRALVLTVSTNGNFSIGGDKNDTTLSANNNSFYLFGGLGYSQLYSTEERQHTASYGANVNLHLGGTKNAKYKTVDNGFDIGASYSQTDRWYQAKHFLELGLMIAPSAYTNKNTVSTINASSSNASIPFSIEVGIGQGRLEDVDDAQMALFILQDLYVQKYLKSRVDAETAYRFAQLITDIRSTRVQDYRIKRRYELRRIDSFLRANNLVTTRDIDYFTTVNDNWAFALFGGADIKDIFSPAVSQLANGFVTGPTTAIVQPTRYSGTIRYVRLFENSYYTYSNNKTDSLSSKTSSFSPLIGIMIGAERHTPINLEWQKIAKAGLSVGYNKNNLAADSVVSGNLAAGVASNSGTFADLSGAYGMGYYPNTRTAINLSVNADIAYIKQQHAGSNIFSSDLNANASAIYFVNYFTQVTAQFILIAVPYITKGFGHTGLFPAFGINYVHVFY